MKIFVILILGFSAILNISLAQTFNFPCDKKINKKDTSYNQLNFYPLKQFYDTTKKINFSKVDFILFYHRSEKGQTGYKKIELSIIHYKNEKQWRTFYYSKERKYKQDGGEINIESNSTLKHINYTMLWDSLIMHDVLLLPETKSYLPKADSTKRPHLIQITASGGWHYNIELYTTTCFHKFSCNNDQLQESKHDPSAFIVQFSRLINILDEVIDKKDKKYRTR